MNRFGNFKGLRAIKGNLFFLRIGQALCNHSFPKLVASKESIIDSITNIGVYLAAGRQAIEE